MGWLHARSHLHAFFYIAVPRGPILSKRAPRPRVSTTQRINSGGSKNTCSDAPHSLDDPQTKRLLRVTRISLESGEIRSRRVQVPALRRGQGPAVVSLPQAPRNTRYLQGAPLVPIRDLVATPAPPPEVLMVPRGPFEPATCPVDLRGHFVGEILIARIQGPPAQEIP